MKYLLIFAICAMFFIFTPLALAEPEIPVDIFYLDGMVCVVWPDGSGECHCPCDEPLPDCARPTQQPTDIPPPQPTDKPPAEPTPQPTPKLPKPACNRGRGNGPEFCDPGNSGGKPGNAGEGNE